MGKKPDLVVAITDRCICNRPHGDDDQVCNALEGKYSRDGKTRTRLGPLRKYTHKRCPIWLLFCNRQQPSPRTALRMLAYWRSLPAVTVNLCRIWSMLAGSTLSLSGALFLSAPGSRANIGTQCDGSSTVRLPHLSGGRWGPLRPGTRSNPPPPVPAAAAPPLRHGLRGVQPVAVGR